MATGFGSGGRALCGVAGVVGAAGAILIWVLFDETSAFPYSGGFFLIGLCTASVILAAVGAPRSVVPRVLSLTPVRYVGRISYGIYIWHWPLFLWINHERTGLEGYPLFVVRVLVTLAVSALSFHLVERPIRMGTFLHQWRVWVTVPVAVVVVVAALIAATVDTSAVASTNVSGSIGTCERGAGRTVTGTTADGGGGTAGARPALRRLRGPHPRFGPRDPPRAGQVRLPALRRGDPGLWRGRRARRRAARCGRPDTAALQRLDRSPREKPPAPYPGRTSGAMPWPAVKPNVVVVLAGRWEVLDREYKGAWTNILDPVYAAYVKSQLEKASTLVTTTGANLVFFTAPCTDEGEQPDGQPWPEDDPARLAEYNKLVRQVAALHPKTDSVVDLDAAACPGGKFTGPLDGVAVRRSDGIHFTVQGGERPGQGPHACRRGGRPGPDGGEPTTTTTAPAPSPSAGG